MERLIIIEYSALHGGSDEETDETDYLSIITGTKQLKMIKRHGTYSN